MLGNNSGDGEAFMRQYYPGAACCCQGLGYGLIKVFGA